MPTGAEPGLRVAVVHVVALVGAGGEFGGPTTVAVDTVRELARRGHPATLVSLVQGPVPRPPGLTSSSWRVHPAHRLIPRARMLGLFNPLLAVTLWRLFRPGVVVHVHAGRDLVSLTALLLARLRRIPVVAQTHGMVQPRRSRAARTFDAVFLRLLRRAQVVLYLTESERQDLREQLGPHAGLRSARNGVELPPSVRPLPDAPRVVFAARLHPVKRVLAFAEAAALTLGRGVDADWVVYGPDEGELPALLDFIAERPLAGRLRYGGALDHRATTEALGGASVFVLPSSVDWMPMSLLEALAAGRPTVSTWGCGLAPAVAEAEAGLVVEGSPDDIADAVTRLLTDPSLAEMLGSNARRLVREHFTIETVVDELEQVYAEVCNPEATRLTTRSRPA